MKTLGKILDKVTTYLFAAVVLLAIFGGATIGIDRIDEIYKIFTAEPHRIIHLTCEGESPHRYTHVIDIPEIPDESKRDELGKAFDLLCAYQLESINKEKGESQ